MDAGDRLWKAGKKPESAEVLKIGAAESPWSSAIHEQLGDAYLKLGDHTQAAAMYKKAAKLNRRSYPWEIASYDDAERLSKGIKILAKDLERDIDEKGIDAAVKSFDQAKAGNPSSYYVDENKMNQLGYHLLNRGKAAEAIEVFKLNVREFPKSSNAYDSLGEAYAKAGSRELAIQNYRRSNELDPNNSNALEAIKRLTGAEEKIDTRLLDDYIGKYDSPLGILNITRDGEKLFAQPEGNTKEELVTKSSTRFQAPTVGAEVEFVRDERGQVSKMLIRIGGQQMEARKIK